MYIVYYVQLIITKEIKSCCSVYKYSVKNSYTHVIQVDSIYVLLKT
jgi:hypothetical protein